jgi:hypothetical protein
MPRWSPSCWDKHLPEDLYERAKDIGERVYARLCKEWTEDDINEYFPVEDENGYTPYYEPKFCFRVLVGVYMDKLPRDDPDVVAYNNLRVEADGRRETRLRAAKNKRTHERAKERKRMNWLANHGPVMTGLPGIQST